MKLYGDVFLIQGVTPGNIPGSHISSLLPFFETIITGSGLIENSFQ
jgi:hypothetical protein